MARVLVIDDEELVRALLVEVLAGAGHEVETAEDGAAGLSLFRASSFDLVVTDILMPVMDGLEVIGELRAEATPPRIVATAAVGDTALEHAQRAGADSILHKPFKIDVLLNVVETLLERET